MSNIDMIIQNLQEQKGRFVTQSGLFDKPKERQEVLLDRIQIADEDEENEEEASGNEPSVDPIAALHNESQVENLRLRGQAN